MAKAKSLTEFVALYNGKTNVGNTPENKGECVGLVVMWILNLGLTHFYGHAKDFFTNSPNSQYTKINNAPSVYPKAGDIIIWDKTAGGGFGHVAIVVESDPASDTFTVFEQNNPGNVPGRACEVTTYKNWAGVIGWIRPRVSETNDLAELEKILKDLEKENGELRASRNKWKRDYSDLEKEYKRVLSSKEEHIKQLQRTNADLSANVSDITSQNTVLTARNSEVEKKLKDYENVLIELEMAIDGFARELELRDEQIVTLNKQKDQKLCEYPRSERIRSLFLTCKEAEKNAKASTKNTSTSPKA